MKQTFCLGTEIITDACGHYDSVSFTEMTIDYDAISILLPVVCPNCGKTNLLSNFCPNCGERIKAKEVVRMVRYDPYTDRFIVSGDKSASMLRGRLAPPTEKEME